MKHIIVFLILFLSIGISISAESAEPSKPNEKIELIKHDRRQGNHRHRMPARHNEVDCYYQNGFLSLSFEYSEGNATISITDLMETPCFNQQFSTSMPFYLFIGEVDQPLRIEIITESHIYTGCLNQY